MLFEIYISKPENCFGNNLVRIIERVKENEYSKYRGNTISVKNDMISAKYDTNHIFFYYDKRKNQIKCLDYQKMIVMEFKYR